MTKVNKVLIAAVTLLVAVYCWDHSWAQSPPATTDATTTPAATEDSAETISLEKIEKTPAEWRKQLTAMQYKVARRAGTERAFSGKYWDNKKAGTYQCVCCGLPLFHSETKYKSGTGWPSFFDPVKKEYVTLKEDRSMFGSLRTEVVCTRCDAHLGHVFNDGPQPTGQRYCMNSAALKFKETETSEGEVAPPSAAPTK